MPATNPTPTPASGPRRPSLTNRLVLSIVRSPAHGVLLGSTTALRYAAGDGHEVTLPVWYVEDEGRLVVLVGPVGGEALVASFPRAATGRRVVAGAMAIVQRTGLRGRFPGT